MSYTYGNKFTRYYPKNFSFGIIQNNFQKYNDFATFNSSTANQIYADKNAILSPDGHWKSDKNETNPYFIVSFSNHLLRLESISMKSCSETECVYILDILGSNEGTEWEKACEIRGHKFMFKANINNTKCVSKYQYKKYKIVHIGPNSSGTSVFPIFFLELFGDLYEVSTRIISICQRHKISIPFFLFMVPFLCCDN